MSLFINEISNIALARIGSSLTISNLEDDNTNQAKIIRTHVQSSLTKLLEMYPWGFATKFAPLALVEENPINSWSFSYQMPSDAVVLRQLGVEGLFEDKENYDDERDKFKEVYSDTGLLIYTNIGQAWAEYTLAIPQGYHFPNHFGRALAAQLALDIAPQLITNNFAKVKSVLISDAKTEINDQIAEDINRKPRPETSKSRFARVR